MTHRTCILHCLLVRKHRVRVLQLRSVPVRTFAERKAFVLQLPFLVRRFVHGGAIIGSDRIATSLRNTRRTREEAWAKVKVTAKGQGEARWRKRRAQCSAHIKAVKVLPRLLTGLGANAPAIVCAAAAAASSSSSFVCARERERATGRGVYATW